MSCVCYLDSTRSQMRLDARARYSECLPTPYADADSEESSSGPLVDLGDVYDLLHFYNLICPLSSSLNSSLLSGILAQSRVAGLERKSKLVCVPRIHATVFAHVWYRLSVIRRDILPVGPVSPTPALNLFPSSRAERSSTVFCPSSAGEILQSHNPDGNLVLSVAARSQLVSLVAQDWAVRATLVMYAVLSTHTPRHPRGPRTTIVRPCAHLALWIRFKALHVFSCDTYSFRGFSISACELPNLQDAVWGDDGRASMTSEWKKNAENGYIERGIYGQHAAASST
ncbi:hypothetical protein B0H13DRAFT_2263919 [Mycena leptocephala]|nr:hypothetical protein B0H13DRAFT_2263919 [Mycena leptocephala]